MRNETKRRTHVKCLNLSLAQEVAFFATGRFSITCHRRKGFARNKIKGRLALIAMRTLGMLRYCYNTYALYHNMYDTVRDLMVTILPNEMSFQRVPVTISWRLQTVWQVVMSNTCSVIFEYSEICRARTLRIGRQRVYDGNGALLPVTCNGNSPAISQKPVRKGIFINAFNLFVSTV
jgi:hypothetical protein